MKNETELVEELDKVVEAIENEPSELKRADIILNHFARMTNSEPKELISGLMLNMRKDISPHDKDPIYIKGMKEGLMLARAAVESSEVTSLKLIEQLGVAYATLTKIEHEFIA